MLRLTYQKILDALVNIACLKVFSLENQNWLHVLINELWWLEHRCCFEVCDSELKHVEDVTIKDAPKHQVIWSLLLMTANSEQAAIVLDRLIFDQTRVLHSDEVMGVSDKHLDLLTAFHQL